MIVCLRWLRGNPAFRAFIDQFHNVVDSNIKHLLHRNPCVMCHCVIMAFRMLTVPGASLNSLNVWLPILITMITSNQLLL